MVINTILIVIMSMSTLFAYDPMEFSTGRPSSAGFTFNACSTNNWRSSDGPSRPSDAVSYEEIPESRQKCLPIYVDNGQIQKRACREVVRNFCSSVKDKLVDYYEMRWDTAVSSLLSVDRLLQFIDSDREFCRRHMWPIDDIVGERSYMLHSIENYRDILKKDAELEVRDNTLKSELAKREKICEWVFGNIFSLKDCNDHVTAARQEVIRRAASSDLKRYCKEHKLAPTLGSHSLAGKLGRCYGNDVQHSLHAEVVDLVNDYCRYLSVGDNMIEVRGAESMFEACEVLLKLCEMLHTEESFEKVERLHKRYCEMIDLCKQYLRAKVLYKMLLYTKKFGSGIKLGINDLGIFYNRVVNDNEIDELEHYDGKTGSIGRLLNDIQVKPLDDAVGETIEFLTRKLVVASAIAAATTASVAAAQCGLNYYTWTIPIFSARYFLERFVGGVYSKFHTVIENEGFLENFVHSIHILYEKLEEEADSLMGDS